jgi:hypothetical protein
LCRIAIRKGHLQHNNFIFLVEFVICFALFNMQLDYCNIQRVHDQRWEPPLFIFSEVVFYYLKIVSEIKWQNVRYIWYLQLLLTMFLSSDVPFLHSKSVKALYMLEVYISYTTHIMLCYLFFTIFYLKERF